MSGIVQAQPEDAPILTAIAHQAKRHWGYPEEWIRSWRDDLTIDPAYIRAHLVNTFKEKSHLLGFYSLVHLDQASGSWELDHLWVAPQAIGRGLGRALFEHAVGQALGAGGRRLSILSDPHAEAFYHRMGARTKGRVDASIAGVERWLPEMELRMEDGSGPDSVDGP